jgi:hypothetical protein
MRRRRERNQRHHKVSNMMREGNMVILFLVTVVLVLGSGVGVGVGVTQLNQMGLCLSELQLLLLLEAR